MTLPAMTLPAMTLPAMTLPAMTLHGVQVWTVAQAATALRLTERTVQRAARAGDLPARRHGGRWLIHADTLLAPC